MIVEESMSFIGGIEIKKLFSSLFNLLGVIILGPSYILDIILSKIFESYKSEKIVRIFILSILTCFLLYFVDITKIWFIIGIVVIDLLTFYVLELIFYFFNTLCYYILEFILDPLSNIFFKCLDNVMSMRDDIYFLFPVFISEKKRKEISRFKIIKL